MNGRVLLFAAVAAGAAVTAVSPAVAAPKAPASQSSWAAQANKVCTVWLAKAKKEFGSPVTPAQLYAFAQKAKSLETQELGVLSKIPGRTAAGTAALRAVVVDINEIGVRNHGVEPGQRGEVRHDPEEVSERRPREVRLRGRRRHAVRLS